MHPTQASALDVSCQIAASHTLFNLLIALVVLPFLRPYARVVRTIVSYVLRDGSRGTATQRPPPPSLEITVV